MARMGETAKEEEEEEEEEEVMLSVQDAAQECKYWIRFYYSFKRGKSELMHWLWVALLFAGGGGGGGGGGRGL